MRPDKGFFHDNGLTHGSSRGIHKITKNTLVKITTNTATLILVSFSLTWDSLTR